MSLVAAGGPRRCIGHRLRTRSAGGRDSAQQQVGTHPNHWVLTVPRSAGIRPARYPSRSRAEPLPHHHATARRPDDERMLSTTSARDLPMITMPQLSQPWITPRGPDQELDRLADAVGPGSVEATLDELLNASLAAQGQLSPEQVALLTSVTASLNARLTPDLWRADQAAYFYARRLLRLAKLVDTALRSGSPSSLR